MSRSLNARKRSFVYFSNRSLPDHLLTPVNLSFRYSFDDDHLNTTSYIYIRNKTAKEGRGIFFQCSMGGLLFVLFVCHCRGGHPDAPHSFPLPLRSGNEGRGSPYACFGRLLVRNGFCRCVCVSLGYIGLDRIGFSSGRLCFCLP